jgi:hypothetical protein
VRLHPDPVFDRLLGDPGAADPTAVDGAARRIAAGDLDGWERFWRTEGDTALQHADDRLAADDVPGARQALLAAADAYGLAAGPLPADTESHRADRLAQVGVFRAAVPLLTVEVQVIGTNAYRFGPAGWPCVTVHLPDDLPAEAGYTRFAESVLAHGLACLVASGDPVPAGGDAHLAWAPQTEPGQSGGTPAGVAWWEHPDTEPLLFPPDTAFSQAMATLADRLRPPLRGR